MCLLRVGLCPPCWCSSRSAVDGRVGGAPQGVRLCARVTVVPPRRLPHPLGDFEPADVIGSAYCIRHYDVDDVRRTPGRRQLAARQASPQRGARLIVDFVPNHVAPDHPWLGAHPEYFVLGDADDLARAPSEFLGSATRSSPVAATRSSRHGPTWPNSTPSPPGSESRHRHALDIGSLADGVRCDMAMLMLNDVFRRTWGDRPGPTPDTEYWTDVISAVRAVHPDMLFVAEAYWDLEWQLQQLGFDYCYDKRLYDRLLDDPPPSSAWPPQRRPRTTSSTCSGSPRTTTNHEPPSQFQPAALRAAAVTIATLPGATMWHEGQFEGWRVHVPVLLGRRPKETR